MPTKLNKEALDDFWYFVQERHNVYHRRFVLKKNAPWTKDPILQQYHFTNVYRELDRGTLYLTEELLPQFSQPADKLFAILVYRLFNHIPTMELLMKQPVRLGKWEWEKRADVLKRWSVAGNTIFTRAFTVTGNPFGGFRSKIDNICWLIDWLQDFLQEKHRGRKRWEYIWYAETMEEAFDNVRGMKGFGAFLAYEIVVDINYAHGRWGEDSFVNTGPGAYRGLQHIFPELERRHGVVAMLWLAKHQPSIVHGKRLTLRNIEHSLCEYQKYKKFQTGSVRGRQRRFLGPQAEPLPKRRG